MKLLPVKEYYCNKLIELAKNKGNLCVLDADLMKASGTYDFAKQFPERHVNVGIAEQHLVSMAAGIASAGGIPVAITMANFMAKRACDQVAISVCYNKLNVKLTGIYAGLTQEKNGGTHVSFLDIAIMRGLPNMKVFIPASILEMQQMMDYMVEDDSPAYLRLAKTLPERLSENDYDWKDPGFVQYGTGNDLAVVSTGLCSSIAVESIDLLKESGIDARVVHIPMLKPVDEKSILEIIDSCKAVITIEDHSVIGGLGGAICEMSSGSGKPVKIKRLGFEDKFGLTAPLDYQLEYFGLSAENILKCAKKIL